MVITYIPWIADIASLWKQNEEKTMDNGKEEEGICYACLSNSYPTEQDPLIGVAVYGSIVYSTLPYEASHMVLLLELKYKVGITLK